MDCPSQPEARTVGLSSGQRLGGQKKAARGILPWLDFIFEDQGVVRHCPLHESTLGSEAASKGDLSILGIWMDRRYVHLVPVPEDDEEDTLLNDMPTIHPKMMQPDATDRRWHRKT